MHDGSLTSLGAVVDFYASGIDVDPDRDPRLVPLDLTAGEKQTLIAFLESLTGRNVAALALDARSVPIGERGATAASMDAK
jgi:cytochrome c peroxidase